MGSSRRINNETAFRLTGHGLRFKTKAEKLRAEEDERKENEERDGSTKKTERSGCPPLPPSDPSAELQDESKTQPSL